METKHSGWKGLGEGMGVYAEHRVFWGSETSLYDNVMVDTHHYIFLKT